MVQEHRIRVVIVALAMCCVGAATPSAQEAGSPNRHVAGAKVGTSSFAPSKRLDGDERVQPRHLYFTAREAEAAASEELIRLDRAARYFDPATATPRQRAAVRAGRPPITPAALRQRETRLSTLDLEVNDKLEDLYRNASNSARPGSDTELVRAALLHWTTLLRRRTMGTLHTVVPGLEDDPRCAGDLIGDQLLLKYFETLFDNPASLAKIREAVSALAALARQSACLGERQSSFLASDLYWSFQELKTFLKYNGLERITPAVANAGAAPLLLFYDVEKHRGLWSPLGRWFSENRDDLVEGSVTHRIPASWQGLWLYHRRTGQLIGFAPTRNPRDENYVDLPSFFDSIVTAENLADHTCTFSEMVMRGGGQFGYMCGGSACQKSSTSTAVTGPGAGAGAAGTRTTKGLGARQAEGGSAPAKSPRAGYSPGLLKETSCKEGGPGAGPCGTGGVTGRDTLAALLNCIATARMTPDEKMLRCTAEASGRCSNPADRYVKQMQQASYAGVPMGTGCQLGAGTDGGTKGTDGGTKGKDGGTKGTDGGTKGRDGGTQGDDGEIIEDDKGCKWKCWIEIEIKTKEQLEKEKKSIPSSQCLEDSPDCGLNNCTAMSSQMLNSMECIRTALGEPAPQLPGGGVFDPADDSPDNTNTLSQCMNTVDVQNPTASQCWTVKCTEHRTTVLSAGGDCVCGNAADPGATPTATGPEGVLCPGLMDCGEDKYQEGCTCVPYGEGLVGGGVPVGPRPGPAPFKVPPPTTTYVDMWFP